MSDYEKLRKLCDEIDELIAKQVTTSSPDFITWHTKLDRFLLEKYGESREEYIDFHKRSFNPPLFTLPAMSKLSSEKITQYYISVCKSALETTKAKLLVYLEKMKEKRDVESKMLKYSNMSVVTFLIGNGFDLQLGLNTRYDQFVRWYIGQPPAENFLRIAEFKEYLEKLDGKDESKLLLNANRHFQISIIKGLLEKSDKCEWLSDLNLPSSKIITIKELLEGNKKSEWLSDINILLKIVEFKEYLKDNEQSEWWSNAEIAMGTYIKNFKDNTDVYCKLVQDFKTKLVEYLKIQEARCDFSNTKENGELFAKFLMNFQKDILPKTRISKLFPRDEKQILFNFINFNYTNTLKLLVDSAKSSHNYGRLLQAIPNSPDVIVGYLNPVCAIHGTLADNIIIMGVNDENQIALSNEKISKELKRVLIKPNINDELDRPERNSAVEAIQSSDIVAIYGLSLGNTDKKWRDLLGDWFKEEKHHIVSFDYKKIEKTNPALPENLLNYEETKQIDFLQKLYPSVSQEDLEHLRKRVFIIDKSSYLDFNILKKDSGEGESNDQL